MKDKLYYIKRQNGKIWEIPTEAEIENTSTFIDLDHERLPPFLEAEEDIIYRIDASADEYIKITKQQMKELAQAIIDQARYDKIGRQVDKLYFCNEDSSLLN